MQPLQHRSPVARAVEKLLGTAGGSSKEPERAPPQVILSDDCGAPRRFQQLVATRNSLRKRWVVVGRSR
jgi:hypothetical protein